MFHSEDYQEVPSTADDKPKKSKSKKNTEVSVVVTLFNDENILSHTILVYVQNSFNGYYPE